MTSERGILSLPCGPGTSAVRPSGRHRFRRLAALAGLLTLAAGLLATAAPAAPAAAGALCLAAAAYWLRRVRHQARHAR